MSSREDTTRRARAAPTARRATPDEVPAPAATAGTVRDLLARGERLGRYHILERIGHGGMGSVYLALDASLERRVAIKVLHADVLGAQQQREQLLAEAKAMAQLAHPNVVTVHEASIDRGRLYLAMEYVPGRTVRAWLADRPRGWREIAEVFRQAALGLAAAHAAGLVHRDVKPDNILVGSDDRVRLTDFGIAIDLGLASSSRSGTHEDEARGDATRSHSGTPAYMSPEQLEGGALDARSDQFSFSVTAYESLFGARPFIGKTPHEIRQAQRVPPREHTDATCPPWLVAIVARALQIDPTRRWPAMEDIADALAAGLAPPPRRVWRALAISAIPVAAMSAWIGTRLAQQPDACDDAIPITEVWNDDRRAVIVAAIAADGSAFANDTARAASQGIDTYAEQWTQQLGQACTRHTSGLESDALFDRRLVCLRSRHRALASLVDVLSQADAGVRANAVAAVVALPRIRECEAARLADESSWAVPDSPAERVRYEAVEDELTRWQTLFDTGRLRDGDAATATTLAQVRELADERLIVRALLLHAAYERALDRFDSAAAAIDEAWAIALRIGDSIAAVKAAVLFIELHGYVQWRRPDSRARAELRAADASALVDRVALIDHELGTELRARVLMSRSRVELRFDQHAALVTATEALATLRQLPDRSPLELARMVVACAAVESATDHGDDARAHYEETLAIYTAELGPEHPDTGTVHNNLGLVQRNLGNDEAAILHLQRAYEISRTALGPEHSSAQVALMNLTITYHRMRDWQHALPLWAQVYRVPAVEDVMWTDLARASEYAVDLDHAGRTTEAIALVATAIDVCRRAHEQRVPGTESRLFWHQWIGALELQARLLDEVGRSDEAATIEDALPAMRAASPP